MMKLTDPDGVEYEIKKPEVTIGRSPKSDIVVDDLMASGNHAHLTKEDGKLMLHDNGSTNGTRINGTDITEPTELSDGDMLGIGETEFKVTIPDESEIKATTVIKKADSDVSKTVKIGRDEQEKLLVDLDTSKSDDSEEMPEPEPPTEDSDDDQQKAADAFSEDIKATDPNQSMTEKIDVDAALGASPKAGMAPPEDDEPAAPSSDSQQDTAPMEAEDIQALRDKMAETPPVEDKGYEPTMPIEDEELAALRQQTANKAASAPAEGQPQAISANEEPQPSVSAAPPPGTITELKDKNIALAAEIAPSLLLPGLTGLGWLYAGDQQRGYMMLGIGGGIVLLNLLLIIPTVFTGIAGVCYCLTLPTAIGVVIYSAIQLNQYIGENAEKFK